MMNGEYYVREGRPKEGANARAIMHIYGAFLTGPA